MPLPHEITMTLFEIIIAILAYIFVGSHIAVNSKAEVSGGAAAVFILTWPIWIIISLFIGWD